MVTGGDLMTALNPYTTRPYSESAVSAHMAGGLIYLTPADRTEVIRRLSLRMTTMQIARRLGCHRRTVERAKARTS